MKFDRLKEIRENKNLTQKDVADILNIDRSTYAGYETGKVLIKTDFLYTICKEYNKSMDEILGKKI